MHKMSNFPLHQLMSRLFRLIVVTSKIVIRAILGFPKYGKRVFIRTLLTMEDSKDTIKPSDNVHPFTETISS